MVEADQMSDGYSPCTPLETDDEHGDTHGDGDEAGPMPGPSRAEPTPTSMATPSTSTSRQPPNRSELSEPEPSEEPHDGPDQPEADDDVDSLDQDLDDLLNIEVDDFPAEGLDEDLDDNSPDELGPEGDPQAKASGLSGRKPSKVEIPSHPTQIGCKSAIYVAKGLPRPGLEPITVLPGRWDATSQDVCKIVSKFQELTVADEEQKKELKVGTFPIFREFFRSSGASVLVECHKEEPRDVFQFVCGVCWHHLLEYQDLASKVGVIFLLFLLFHSQHQHRYAIPVTVDLLEHLRVLRDLCVAQEIFMEFPAILRQMVQQNLLSVGLRATYRNLWFDKHGYLIERQLRKEKDKKEPVIHKPVDISKLQKKVKQFEELSRKVGVSHAGISETVHQIAAASKRFAKSLAKPKAKGFPKTKSGKPAVIEIPDTDDKKAEDKKKTKTRRRRVVDDSDDNDERAASPSKSYLEMQEKVVNGKAVDLWKRVIPKTQRTQALGFDAAVESGAAKRLVAFVEERLAEAAEDQRMAQARTSECDDDPEDPPIACGDAKASEAVVKESEEEIKEDEMKPETYEDMEVLQYEDMEIVSTSDED